MTNGTLILVGKNKSLQISFTNAKGTLVGMQIPAKELSEALTNLKNKKIELLKDMLVEFEEVGGQPKKVREKGQAWDRQEEVVKPTKILPTPKSVISRDATTQQDIKGDFHNPYNFVPALPRKTEHQELADGKPVEHNSYHHNLWSGKISVTLKTITPLLIPDAAKATGKEHKTYPIRVGLDDKPYLPPSSVKGMLRTAYEMITNSRFSVFEEHGDRLAYRMTTEMGLEMIPVRIEEDNSGNKNIRFFSGTSSIGVDGIPDRKLMYAAWLPRYHKGKFSHDAVKLPDGKLPQHQQEVEAWVEKFEHYKWNKSKNKHNKDFEYWKVREIVVLGQGKQLGSEPKITSQSQQLERRSYHQSLGNFHKIRGYVCITNPNIDKKHDERIFFNSGKEIPLQPLSADIEKQWAALITNYQEIHNDEICNKHEDNPPVLINSVWSRHIKGQGYTLARDERNLKHGTLCYARVRKNGSSYEILGLYPVIISRELFKIAPVDLLPKTLEPSTDKNKLSPAERVFGWVNQNGQGAYKGNLRINPITCLSGDGIEFFGEKGFPLAILGEPKEQQARFYQASNTEGKPLSPIPKNECYSNPNQGLRGRKVYPHHRKGLEEHRRMNDERDSQNRSIQAWVKEGVEFKFTIDITNLSPVELGALLWLLSLPENHYHRLGGGKPFGFGSVRLDINWPETDLRKGQDWREYYSTLLPVDAPDLELAEQCVHNFEKAVSDAYGVDFKTIPFIAAFCRAAEGFDDGLPIHYPRTTERPDPKGEGFKWFVENERKGGGKLPLPLLVEDRGLPYNPQNT